MTLAWQILVIGAAIGVASSVRLESAHPAHHQQGHFGAPGYEYGGYAHPGYSPYGPYSVPYAASGALHQYGYNPYAYDPYQGYGPYYPYGHYPYPYGAPHEHPQTLAQQPTQARRQVHTVSEARGSDGIPVTSSSHSPQTVQQVLSHPYTGHGPVYRVPPRSVYPGYAPARAHPDAVGAHYSGAQTYTPVEANEYPRGDHHGYPVSHAGATYPVAEGHGYAAAGSQAYQPTEEHSQSYSAGHAATPQTPYAVARTPIRGTPRYQEPAGQPVYLPADQAASIGATQGYPAETSAAHHDYSDARSPNGGYMAPQRLVYHSPQYAGTHGYSATPAQYASSHAPMYAYGASMYGYSYGNPYINNGNNSAAKKSS